MVVASHCCFFCQVAEAVDWLVKGWLISNLSKDADKLFYSRLLSVTFTYAIYPYRETVKKLLRKVPEKKSLLI